LPSDVAAVEVFQENWPVWDLFRYMASQWRVAFGGATGYDYNVAHHKLDREKLAPDEYECRMDDLMVMEAAALAAMRKQQQEN
jgi:hypothetical protein